jgi:DNA invertase Pin-like site-specific DNA recombinase
VCVQKYFSICKYFSDRGEKSLDSFCLPCYIVYIDNIVNNLKGENIMANYIYIRVSSKDQNPARQLEDAKELNVPEENIYIDKQSGKDFERPAYQELLKSLHEGDVLYLHSIDRLGRNYEMIIDEWRKITKDIKADIIVLDMPLLDTTAKNNDLTGKLIADIVLQLLSYVAQKERESIRQRQAEGIAIAKAEGRFTKKQIDKDKFRQLKADVDKGLLSATTAMAELGISRRTWYKKVKELEENI